MVKLEWNPAKAEFILKKHGVSFEEAQSVFYDEFAIQFFDDDAQDEDEVHSLGLQRSIPHSRCGAL